MSLINIDVYTILQCYMDIIIVHIGFVGALYTNIQANLKILSAPYNYMYLPTGHDLYFQCNKMSADGTPFHFTY